MSAPVAAQRPPPLPELPEPLRGAFVVHLRVAYHGAAGDGERLLAPMRALGSIAADTVGVGGPGQADDLRGYLAKVVDRMQPWSEPLLLPNFLSADEATTADELRAVYGADRYRRLASIKDAYDPANMFRVNHNIRSE